MAQEEDPFGFTRRPGQALGRRLRPQNERQGLQLAPIDAQKNHLEDLIGEEHGGEPAVRTELQQLSETLPQNPDPGLPLIYEGFEKEPEVSAPLNEAEQQFPESEPQVITTQDVVIGVEHGGESSVQTELQQLPETVPQALKVVHLKPSTPPYFSLKVKIVAKEIERPRGNQNARCKVGDETAVITFVARQHQVALMEVGSTVLLRDAKIEKCWDGSIRLVVDKHGFIHTNVEPAEFSMNEYLDITKLKSADWRRA